MARKNKTGAGGGLNTRQSADGSFEIVLDEKPDSTKSVESVSSTSRSRRWIAVVAICGLAIAGGTWVFAFAGDDSDAQESVEESDPFADEPGFEPYTGGSVPIEEDTDKPDESAGARAQVIEEQEQEPSGDDESEADQKLEGPVRGLRQPGTLAGREIDGKEVVEDTRGEPMSRQEAERRLEGELDSIENADTEAQRRLRRRDIRMNSRVIQSNSSDGIRVSPGIEVSEDIQKRLHDQFSGRHARAMEEGVDRDEYRGAEEDDWYDEEDDWYDDEYEDGE